MAYPSKVVYLTERDWKAKHLLSDTNFPISYQLHHLPHVGGRQIDLGENSIPVALWLCKLGQVLSAIQASASHL